MVSVAAASRRRSHPSWDLVALALPLLLRAGPGRELRDVAVRRPIACGDHVGRLPPRVSEGALAFHYLGELTLGPVRESKRRDLT